MNGENLDIEGAEIVLKALRTEVGRHIIGQNVLVDRLLIALLADGHVLIEGVPGLAKTRTLSVLTACIDAHMSRIQFTADLLPSDLVGTEIYRASTGEFEIRQGPIFTNLLLADEINRAPAKVQSALLQSMQERQVTIGETTMDLPNPFLVLATQNPIEQEGTYPLPEAQLDRFLFKVKVGYPTGEEEFKILNLPDANVLSDVKKVASLDDLAQVSATAAQVFVDPRVDRYIVSLCQATRNADSFGLAGIVEWGASPRAGLAFKNAAKGLALLRGRGYVTPDDVQELAPEILRHRILLSFEGEARGLTTDEVIKVLLKSVTVP